MFTKIFQTKFITCFYKYHKYGGGAYGGDYGGGIHDPGYGGAYGGGYGGLGTYGADIVSSIYQNTNFNEPMFHIFQLNHYIKERWRILYCLIS